jgi:hypothetical protein
MGSTTIRIRCSTTLSDPRHNVAYARGVHSCPGGPLARIEGRLRHPIVLGVPSGRRCGAARTSTRTRDLIGLSRICGAPDREPRHADGLALVHRSCPATAQIFGATGGYYCRYAISHTKGATFGPHPTAEDVAANWDRIGDQSLPNELDGEAMAWGVKAYSTRLQALAAELQTAG